MTVLVYCIVIFAATVVGAIVGMGGGVIIKPMLDLIGAHSVEVVGFISTCAVFAMSISSSIKHIKAKTKIEPKIVLLVSLGSIAGGILGNSILNFALGSLNQNLVKAIQACFIGGFLIFVIIYVNTNMKRFKITNSMAIVVVGLTLGVISAFLGIGGGPINTAILVLLFSYTVKESAVYSVAIIFFSQLSQLTTIFIDNKFEPFKAYTPIILAAMIISVAGGLIGSKLNRKLSDNSVTKIFSITLGVVVLINIYNAITGFCAV